MLLSVPTLIISGASAFTHKGLRSLNLLDITGKLMWV